MKDHMWNRTPTWMAVISTIMGVIAITFLAIQIAQPVGANDLWWHMLLGRHILETGSLIIDHSIFTWTPATPYHVYNSWLADIILYLTYENAGTVGLLALRYGVFFLFFFLAWHYAITRGVAKNPLAWLIVLVALTIIWPAHLIKPELFTLGFFTTVVWLFFHMRTRGDLGWWLPYLFPLLLVIWINIHGAFFISSLFFASTVIGELLNHRLSPNQAMAPTLRRHYFIALALCIPAILLSPFGYELPISIIREVLTGEGLNRFIVSYKPTYEFNSSPLYALDYMLISMLLFVFLIWQKLKNRQTDWIVILVFLGYSAIYTQVARLAFFLGPAFMFICLDLLAEKRESWAWPTSKTAKVLFFTLCLSITSLIVWRSISDNSCKLCCSAHNLQRTFGISKSFPIAETKYINENLSGTKIGNIYQSGGYLLYHLWPKKQVMIDPRYFPFKNWIYSYISFASGNNIEQFVLNNHADYWLIDYTNTSTFQWFYRSDDWNLHLLGVTGAIFTPSDDIDKKPKISPSIETMMGFSQMKSAFTVAMQLDDLTFARKILETAQKSSACSCERHTTLIKEIKDVITGLQDYNRGNYKKAARILSKKTWNYFALKKAADAFVLLAEESWKRGDIISARKWYQEAIKLPIDMTITVIYNYTLLDWLYSSSDNIKRITTSNDLRWQMFVDIILQQENNVPSTHSLIVETARAMKENRYDGPTQLILRDGSLSSLNSVRKNDIGGDNSED